MQKCVVRALGGPEQLQMESSEPPQPGAGELLVAVEVAGVNYVDVYQRKGVYKLPLPYTPGHEGVGTVIAVGPDIASHRVGQRVAWINVLGSYAESMVIPARQAIVLPDSLKPSDGLLFQAVTAHYLLTEYRSLREGDCVLVHAAAGGVGQILVQWAKHLGATVIGTASGAAKAERIRALGADHVIDYSGVDFQAEVMRITNQRGVDLALDSVGKDTFLRSVQSLARGGTAVSYGAASGAAPAIEPALLMPKALRVAGGSVFGFVADADQLQSRSAAALEGITAGWLVTGNPTGYELCDAHRAHSDLESRSTQGKLILIP